MRTHHNKTQSGIALYVAVLISSLVLAISLSIGNIFLKEVKLSISSRDSQIAFYAADSGLECARYWDTVLDGSKFGSTTNAANQIICAGITIRSVNGSDNHNPGNTNAQVASPSGFQFDSQIGCYSTEPPLSGTEVPGGSSSASPSECGGALGSFGDPMVIHFTVPYLNYRNGAPGVFPDVPCAILTVRKEAIENTAGTGVDGYTLLTTIESRGYNTCDPSDVNRIERAIRVQ